MFLQSLCRARRILAAWGPERQVGARVTNPCSTRQQFASCLPSASVPCLRPPAVLWEGPFSYLSLSELTAGFEHVSPGPSCRWTPPLHWAIEGSQKKQDAEVHVQNQIVFIPTVWPCCLGGEAHLLAG